MKKILIAVTLALLLFSSVFAQELSIKIGHIGFGVNSQEAVFSIHNTGEKPLTNIGIYVDGKLFKTINALLTSRQGIEVILELDSGQHTVEARSAEGASNTVVVTLAPQTQITEQVTPQTVLTMYKQVLAILVILALIFVVWLVVKRKPKL